MLPTVLMPVLAACDVQQAVRLPLDPTWLGGCSEGVGRDATLHGSPLDLRVTWAIDNSSGRRVELLWPVGYKALFDPGLVILDRTNAVVAGEGDQIVGSCLGRDAGGAIRVEAREVIRPMASASEPVAPGRA
jgi:hypothetical protein